ncbi:MAG: hypothetical protein FWF35_03315 [Elusimicrobia bacterium]|nr:hypothetical protein [Elusimicrobiota bacterium]
MIETWDIKNAEGVITLFMQGSLNDARLMQKKLAGYCKEPVQTSIPPYNYRMALTTNDREILEKIKIAAAEAAESSRVVLPFMPATLESAAAQRDTSVLEGTLFALKRDDEVTFPGDPGVERLTSVDLDSAGLKIAEDKKDDVLEPVKPVQEEKENFGNLDNVNNLVLEGTTQDLNLARTVIQAEKEVPAPPPAAEPVQPPAVPAAAPAPENMPFMPAAGEEKSDDIKPQIDALLTKVFAKQEVAGTQEEKKQPLGLEGILAAKTALDVYASADFTKEKDKSNILSKEEDAKIQELLSKTQKTAFNIFEQEIKKQEEAEDHAVDPFDLLASKTKDAAPAPPKVIPGKKGFDKKPQAHKTPVKEETKKSEPAPAPSEAAGPADINLDKPALTAPPAPPRIINPNPEAEETTGMPKLKITGVTQPAAPKGPEAYFGPSMDVVGGPEFEEKTQKSHSYLTKKINGTQNAPSREEGKADNFINPFDNFENDKHEQSFIAEIDKKNSDKK